MSRRRLTLAASDLLMQMSTSQPMCSAKAVTLSMRKGSVTGFTSEATAISRSIFATAGRMKKFFLGSSLSTRPFPLASSDISTLSPTSGDEPSSRKRPRALHSTVPLSVLT